MNTFLLLAGSTAFMRELNVSLAACQRSLYVQFMTYEGDQSGLAFSNLLAEKAAAGVDVRLMVDGYSDVVISDVYPLLIHKRHSVNRERTQTQALFESLRARSVGVKRTAPPGFLNMYILYRNHKKMIVIDDQVAFVGGINISDHNYSWHDFMVKIEGPLVRDLARDFCSTWAGSPIVLDTPVSDGDFILNQCAGRYSLFEETLAMIERAERTLVIESPYLLGNRIEPAIRAAATRGVRVNIITPLHSNKWLYRLWSRKLHHRLNHPNITIYGHAGNGGMTHAKLMIVDDRWATFGSFNMIELEGLTQKELNVFSSDPSLIAQLNAFVTEDLAHATPISPPRFASVRLTYRALYHFHKWWTKRLLQNPKWKAIYC